MLKEYKEQFLSKKLEKFDYMEKMFQLHKVLYDYADFIKASNCREISIKDGEVIFDLLSGPVNVKMTCIPFDVTSVPFTFLDMGGYDEPETEFLMGLAGDNDVILDVGANTGWYTINWLKRNKRLKVFSFEPLPQLFEKLLRNLELNGCRTQGAFNFGLADKNAQADFYFDTQRCGASSLVNLRDTQDALKIKCPVKRLDDIFGGLGVRRLDLVKCDVEGAEKLVFDGGWATLKKYRPLVYSEMLRKWSKKFDYHPNDLLKNFSGLGYICFAVKGGRASRINQVSEETEETNFLFLDPKKHAELLPKLDGENR